MGAHQHQHQHPHEHGCDHEAVDYGTMYSKPWVQKLIRILEQWLQQNHSWLGLDQTQSQRLLDYACGNGTVSRALLTQCPHTTFRGLDNSASQVQRFNDEAHRLLGNSSERMSAIVGDLDQIDNPELEKPEWFGFDVAIMSMALHHVKSPIEMLRRLSQRLRKGGVLIIVEFTSDVHNESPSDEREEYDFNPDKMIAVNDSKEKIWPGFTTGTLASTMRAAGCSEVKVRLHEEMFEIPEAKRDNGHGGKKRLLFARAVVN